MVEQIFGKFQVRLSAPVCPKPILATNRVCTRIDVWCVRAARTSCIASKVSKERRS